VISAGRSTAETNKEQERMIIASTATASELFIFAAVVGRVVVANRR